MPSARRIAAALVAAALVCTLPACTAGPAVTAPPASPTPAATPVDTTAPTATATATPPAPSTPATPTTPTVAPAQPTATATPSATATATARPLRPVQVVVTYSGTDAHTGDVGVAGYVGGVEDGGTCTLTLSSGGTSVTATQAALADVSTTTCGTMTVARAKLHPGTWTAVLRYRSPLSEGSSAPVSVVVTT